MNAAQFAVYTGTRPTNLKEVIGIIRSEFEKILQSGVSIEELKRVQEYLVGHSVLANESTSARMSRLGRNYVNGIETLDIDEIIARYRAVTCADIQRVAERVLSLEPTVAVISPFEQEEVAELLAC
jgi:predicted Zn-dependent peptidase